MDFITSTNGSSSTTKTTDTQLIFGTGQWYHVAVTRDGSNNLRFFVNGALVYQVTNSDTFYNNAHACYIGCLNSGGSIQQTVNGWLDDMRILNTCAYTKTFIPPDQAFV